MGWQLAPKTARRVMPDLENIQSFFPGHGI